MIVLDTESTNLGKPDVVPLDQQPEMIEFAARKLDDGTLEDRGGISFLICPKLLPLSDLTVKVTGITTDMLQGQPRFAARVPALTQFFLGERTLVAHNAGHDVRLLASELQRLDRLCRFPWPCEHLDTVELTMDLEAPRQKSSRLKLGELYCLATGKAPEKAHRALDDVNSLVAIVRWLRAKDGRI
jgi:DNA polymerase III epsilon subunit-like protein